MNLPICKRCGRHHSEGLCPARTIPKYPPKKLLALSSSLSEWLVIYERNLHELGGETKENVLLAEKAADREVQQIYKGGMTSAQRTEWQYHYTERLGILCEDQEPTQQEITLAKKDADEAV